MAGCPARPTWKASSSRHRVPAPPSTPVCASSVGGGLPGHGERCFALAGVIQHGDGRPDPCLQAGDSAAAYCFADQSGSFRRKAFLRRSGGIGAAPPRPASRGPLRVRRAATLPAR